MKNLIRAALLGIGIAVLTTGCIIVPLDDDGYHHHHRCGYHDRDC